ncbi:MAG: 30S ribosomal protein S18 [Acidobacteriota bacterium]
MVRRRRYCKFCSDKVDYIDYKDVRTLTPYVPEGSKMTPRRLSGVCSSHQRKLSRAIKRARHLALLSYIPD